MSALLYRNPYVSEIIDATAAGKDLLSNGASKGALSLGSDDNFTITSLVSGYAGLVLTSTGAAEGGLVLAIDAPLSKSAGRFSIGSVDFINSWDGTYDNVVVIGHGFAANGGLASGATNGAAGWAFENRYSLSSSHCQSETYIRLYSLQGVGGTQYRPIAVTHQRHDLSSGGDSVYVNFAADTLEIFDKTTTTSRAKFTSTNMILGSTMAFQMAAGVVNITSGGVYQSTALNNVYSPTLNADSKMVFSLNPAINLSSGNTGLGMEISPSWTGATGATFYGIRFIGYGSKSASVVGGFEAHPGVNGAGVTIGTAFGFRVNPQTYGGTNTNMRGFHCQSPTVTGTLSNFEAFRADDCTGYYAWRSGTGKHLIGGDGTANTLIGLHGATPIARQTITGSRGGNAALANLLTWLATRGDIVDGTTA